MSARKLWLLILCSLLLTTSVSGQKRRMVRRFGVAGPGRVARITTAATNLLGPAALHSFIGHHAAVRSVAYTPDGRFLVTAGYDNCVRVWGLASHKELRCLRGHTGPIISIAVCPDGRHAVSGSLDKTIRLWDLNAGKEVHCFRGHDKEVHHVAVSPDGQRIASASYDGTARIWDRKTGKQLLRLSGERGSVLVVTFSPDGRLLASGGEDHQITLWDVSTGRQVRQLKGDTDSILGLAFSPDGQLLASASHDRTIRLWRVETGKELRRIEPGPAQRQFGGVGADARMRSVAFSPDGQTLAGVGMDHAVHLWETATGRECVQYTGYYTTFWEVAFAPDGLTLATTSEDQQARTWDTTCRGGLTPATLTEQQLNHAWEALASHDAAHAYRAVWTMIATPDHSVPFMQKHLHAPSQQIVDSSSISQLMTRLDDDSPFVREQATDALARLGKAAEPALRRAVASTDSAEVRLRARMLLEHLQGVFWAPDALQRLRAIRVLEHAGTAQARKLLRTLAGQQQESPVATEAQAALDRLTRRNS